MAIEDYLTGRLITQLGVQVSPLGVAAQAMHLGMCHVISREHLLAVDCHEHCNCRVYMRLLGSSIMASSGLSCLKQIGGAC